MNTVCIPRPRAFSLAAASDFYAGFVPGSGMATAALDELVAIDVLGAWVPDVLVIDIAMPDVDGYELLAAVRTSARLRHIPAVAVTARAFDAGREKCFEAGFAEHITKPTDVPLLIAVIRSLATKR
jgi:CheY-like chemotaxis protein